METPKTEISYDIICDKMPIPQSHYSTYELAEKWAKMKLAFDEPVYIVKRTTTYEICDIIGKKKEKKWQMVHTIRNETGCPYWSIIGCLKLCDYDYKKTIKMLKEIYFVIGDNPDSVIKRREKELKERMKEKE